MRKVGTRTAQIQRIRITGSDAISVGADHCTGALAPAHSCAVSLVVRPTY